MSAGAAGRRLFAQYAHAPNSLGYCGPQDSASLQAVACGKGDPDVVTGLARGFSGAWPYQRVIAAMTSHEDPLEEDVVRAYWTGNGLTDDIDRFRFGTELLDGFDPRAAAHWSHLDDSLLPEVAPTHAFHVFSVYPWTRLLESGRPEPLQVLEACRIGVGTVAAVETAELVVRSRPLRYADHCLFQGAPVESRVAYRVPDGTFVGEVSVGDLVALHWNFACDLLSADQATSLERWTEWQLEAIAPRLASA